MPNKKEQNSKKNSVLNRIVSFLRSDLITKVLPATATDLMTGSPTMSVNEGMNQVKKNAQINKILALKYGVDVLNDLAALEHIQKGLFEDINPGVSTEIYNLIDRRDQEFQKKMSEPQKDLGLIEIADKTMKYHDHITNLTDNLSDTVIDKVREKTLGYVQDSIQSFIADKRTQGQEKLSRIVSNLQDKLKDKVVSQNNSSLISIQSLSEYRVHKALQNYFLQQVIAYEKADDAQKIQKNKLLAEMLPDVDLQNVTTAKLFDHFCSIAEKNPQPFIEQMKAQVPIEAEKSFNHIVNNLEHGIDGLQNIIIEEKNNLVKNFLQDIRYNREIDINNNIKYSKAFNLTYTQKNQLSAEMMDLFKNSSSSISIKNFNDPKAQIAKSISVLSFPETIQTLQDFNHKFHVDNQYKDAVEYYNSVISYKKNSYSKNITLLDKKIKNLETELAQSKKQKDNSPKQQEKIQQEIINCQKERIKNREHLAYSGSYAPPFNVNFLNSLKNNIMDNAEVIQLLKKNNPAFQGIINDLPKNESLNSEMTKINKIESIRKETSYSASHTQNIDEYIDLNWKSLTKQESDFNKKPFYELVKILKQQPIEPEFIVEQSIGKFAKTAEHAAALSTPEIKEVIQNHLESLNEVQLVNAMHTNKEQITQEINNFHNRMTTVYKSKDIFYEASQITAKTLVSHDAEQEFVNDLQHNNHAFTVLETEKKKDAFKNVMRAWITKKIQKLEKANDNLEKDSVKEQLMKGIVDKMKQIKSVNEKLEKDIKIAEYSIANDSIRERSTSQKKKKIDVKSSKQERAI